MNIIERIKLWFQRRRGWPLSLIRRKSSYSVEEQRELMKALAHYPGFVLLMEHLEMVKAHYEREDKKLIPHKETGEFFVRRVISIKEAIFWIGWLQARVKAAGVEVPLPPPEPEQY